MCEKYQIILSDDNKGDADVFNWMNLIQQHQLFSICSLQFFSVREKGTTVSLWWRSPSVWHPDVLFYRPSAPGVHRWPQIHSQQQSRCGPFIRWTCCGVFRKRHWLSNLASFWLRLKLETWSGSARPPLVKELLLSFFFLPLNHFKLSAGKKADTGQAWVFKPEVMSPVN